MMKVLVLALLASGCSVVLQQKPAILTMGHAEQPCATESKLWLVDAAIAGLGAAATIGGRAYADSSPENETAAYAIAGLGSVIAVAYLASAGNGRTWNRICREQKSMPMTASR